MFQNDEINGFADMMLAMFEDLKNTTRVVNNRREFTYKAEHLEQLDDIIVEMYRYAKKLRLEDTLSFKSTNHTKQILEFAV